MLKQSKITKKKNMKQKKIIHFQHKKIKTN